MEQKKKPYQWKKPKRNDAGNILDGNGNIFFEFIDLERIVLTPYPRESKLTTTSFSYSGSQKQWSTPRYAVTVLDENKENIVLSPGDIEPRYYSVHKEAGLTKEQETFFKSVVAGTIGFSEKIMDAKPEKNLEESGLFLQPELGKMGSSLEHPWAEYAVDDSFSTQKATGNLDNVINDFFAIVQENPGISIPRFSDLREFMFYAITLYNKDSSGEFSFDDSISHYTNSLFLEHKNCIEMARYLPRFLEQNEYSTLSEFIINSKIKPTYDLPFAKKSLRFIIKNSRQLAKKKVYDNLLDTNKYDLILLIKKNQELPSSGSVDAILFDLSWSNNIEKEWGSTAVEIRKSHLKSFLTLYDFAEKSSDVYERQRIVSLVSDIERDSFRLLTPISRTIKKFKFEYLIPMKIVEMIKEEESNTSYEKLYDIYGFLNNSYNWVSSDAEKTVLKYMFHKFSNREVLDIAFRIKKNERIRGITVSNWFKYLDNYENHSKMPLEWALELDNKQKRSLV